MLAKRFSMHKPSRISSVAFSLAMTAAVCSAQSVTSAHSGTLHYFEGDVSIDGVQAQSKVGRFTEMKEQQVLTTAQGRAEVLLTPGVFLRVGENTSIKLLDNRLVSTRVELLSGTAMVESDDPQLTIKDSPVTMIYKDYQIQMLKHGVIEIGSDPATLKVFKGEAVVNTVDLRANVKEGRQMPFSAALLTEKFDDKVGDDLYLWTRDRSQSLSAASMSSARSLNSSMGGFGSGYGSGYGYGGLGSGLGLGGGLYGSGLYGAGLGSPYGGFNGGWYYNQFFDMFTFVPMGGAFFNAFGYGFYSPSTINNYYTPGTYWYGGGGARGTGAIGQPLGTSGAPTRTALPINTLRAGNIGATGGMPALGNPVRGGGQVGGLSNGASSGSAARSGGMSSGGSRGGGMSSGGGSRGGGMSSGGGHSGGGHR